MRIVNVKKLSREEGALLQFTKEIALRSVTDKGHRVGCIIVCSDKTSHMGVTVARTRAIGSTCAERMALDKWYFSDNKATPVTCYLVGRFVRKSWHDECICTPCGVCLEMFLELFVDQKLSKLRFVCGNWKLTKALTADLSELFPQIGKGGWPYRKHRGG